MKTKRYQRECESCESTGLYQGFCERKDEAVVCSCCKGRGWYYVYLKPFIRRRLRKGIKKIRFGSGLFIDKPTEKSWFTYKEFLKKVKV